MSVEAVLTVVTIALAVLTLIPSDRANDLRIRSGGAVKTAWVIAGSLVVYWSLIDQVHSFPGLRNFPRPIPWLWNWTPASASLAVLLLAAVFTGWSYKRRLPPSRVPRLAVVLGDALARRRYGECIHLLGTHIDTIRRALEGIYWQHRLRQRLLPTRPEQLIQVLRTTPPVTAESVKEDKTPSQDENTSSALADALLDGTVTIRLKERRKRGKTGQALLSWSQRPQDSAHDLVRSISLAPGLIREIAASHPYLGARLITLESSWLLDSFAETFASALISDPESVLFRELRRAENIDSHNVPVVDERDQPLLALLRTDACRENGSRIFYTFLDAGIDPLRPGLNEHLVARLNLPTFDYFERERWHSPPFASIYLLEIVAPHNAVDKHAHPINLFVLDGLASLLLTQLNPSEDVDLTREWPTPIHYLLYEVVSLLCDLVMIARDRADELRSVVDYKAAYQKTIAPLTLPIHAIQVLGRVMYQCLRSERLDGHFKGYLLEVWWRAYWQKYKDEWSETNDILEALARGGRDGDVDMRHKEGLQLALNHIDWVNLHSPGGDRLRNRFGIVEK